MTAPDDLAARVLAAIATAERDALRLSDIEFYEDTDAGQPAGWHTAYCAEGMEAGHLCRWQTSGPEAEVREAVHDHFRSHWQSVARRWDADRGLVEAVMAWEHVYNDEDSWYSCSQAVVPPNLREWPEDAVPGGGCSNENRAGEPCDCGVAARQLTVLTALAAGYGVLEPAEAS